MKRLFSVVAIYPDGSYYARTYQTRRAAERRARMLERPPPYGFADVIPERVTVRRSEPVLWEQYYMYDSQGKAS